jgi:hypothetical protein
VVSAMHLDGAELQFSSVFDAALLLPQQRVVRERLQFLLHLLPYLSVVFIDVLY